MLFNKKKNQQNVVKTLLQKQMLRNRSASNWRRTPRSTMSKSKLKRITKISKSLRKIERE